jgi:hypothetical protein
LAGLAAELRDWIASCPRPPLNDGFDVFYGVVPWRTLETGIRMYESWSDVLEHLLGTDLLPPELLADYAVSCYEHGEVLAEICPKQWPEAHSNQYVMDNLGLLALSCTFPQLRQSRAWQEQAMRELERCAVVH